MFIVPASKQNRLKPHRGGMVRSGEGHAAPTELERIIGGTVTIHLRALHGRRSNARLRECDNRLKTVLWQAGSEVGFCRQPAKQAPRESSAHVLCSFRLRARAESLNQTRKALA